SHSCICSLALCAAAITTPTCWPQTKAVDRQPDANASPTAQTVEKSAWWPPASTGPDKPYRPACANASRRSTGTASLRSVARARATVRDRTYVENCAAPGEFTHEARVVDRADAVSDAVRS